MRNNWGIKAVLHLVDSPKDHIGILIIHGFTATPETMQPITDALISDGYSVYCPLLCGHNRNTDTMPIVPWTQWLDDVLNAYDLLSQHCQKLVVIGFSLGGGLALQLATMRPVAELILLNPAVFPSFNLSLVPFLKPIYSSLRIDSVPGLSSDIKAPHEKKIAYKHIPLAALEEVLKCMTATRQIISAVHCKTLAFFSRVDHLLPIKKATVIFNLIGSTQKELVWLHNSFHVIPLDNDIDKVIEKIKYELETLSQKP